MKKPCFCTIMGELSTFSSLTFMAKVTMVTATQFFGVINYFLFLYVKLDSLGSYNTRLFKITTAVISVKIINQID